MQFVYCVVVRMMFNKTQGFSRYMCFISRRPLTKHALRLRDRVIIKRRGLYNFCYTLVTLTMDSV